MLKVSTFPTLTAMWDAVGPQLASPIRTSGEKSQTVLLKCIFSFPLSLWWHLVYFSGIVCMWWIPGGRTWTWKFWFGMSVWERYLANFTSAEDLTKKTLILEPTKWVQHRGDLSDTGLQALKCPPGGFVTLNAFFEIGKSDVRKIPAWLTWTYPLLPGVAPDSFPGRELFEWCTWYLLCGSCCYEADFEHTCTSNCFGSAGQSCRE